MNVQNCPRCNKLFTKIRSPICPACEKAEEETFEKLKKFIDENPHCTMAQVSAETEVPLKRIVYYIREGRLEISKGMHGEMVCAQCGKPISRGSFCDACANKAMNDFGDLANQRRLESMKKSDNRMHSRTT